MNENKRTNLSFSGHDRRMTGLFHEIVSKAVTSQRSRDEGIEMALKTTPQPPLGGKSPYTGEPLG